jgi:hypothetical protein
VAKEYLWLYRSIDGELIGDPIQPYLTKTDAMGHLVAKFSGIEIRKIVVPDKVELTLIGPGIEASDTIMVKQ